MAKKFLEALEKYTKEMGINLSEAVPGTTNVMSPPVTSNTAGQPNNGVEQMSIEDLTRQEADHVKTVNDVNGRIQSKHATPEDYAALTAATTGLGAIQQAKAKLAGTQGQPSGAAATVPTSPSTNPLVKPLA